jgi:chromosome segregation ATPase
LTQAIKALKDEQLRIRADKQRVAKELKNAQRRKNRLRKRARQLTDQDLVEVLRMRADDQPADVHMPQEPKDHADDALPNPPHEQPDVLVSD